MSSQLSPDATELFDCIRTFIFCNNSENSHIYKNKRYFRGEIRPVNPTSGVTTIGGTNFRPLGIGTVKLYWQDDEGRKDEFTLKNVLQITDSPANILSIPDPTNGLDKDEGF